jgi:hypothetical protein
MPDRGQKITIDDIRKTGHCVAGARDWFFRHDLDFRDFIRNGIEEEKFLASGDVIAAQIVQATRDRRGNG